MYSNNDYRYYKEGSYLAHYGKKGMKWKKHLKATTMMKNALNTFKTDANAPREMAVNKSTGQFYNTDSGRENRLRGAEATYRAGAAKHAQTKKGRKEAEKASKKRAKIARTNNMLSKLMLKRRKPKSEVVYSNKRLSKFFGR